MARFDQHADNLLAIEHTPAGVVCECDLARHCSDISQSKAPAVVAASAAVCHAAVYASRRS